MTKNPVKYQVLKNNVRLILDILTLRAGFVLLRLRGLGLL